jgi:hypothetical protein
LRCLIPYEHSALAFWGFLAVTDIGLPVVIIFVLYGDQILIPLFNWDGNRIARSGIESGKR